MLKKILITFAIAAGSVLPTVAIVQPLYAQSIADNVCKGILGTETGKINEGTTVAACAQSGDQTLAGVMRRVINIFSIVVGSVSVIMIIIGGFRYIISGGDSTGVTAAKNTILYAIVGLVIVLFSQVIVRFVITNISTAAK